MDVRPFGALLLLVVTVFVVSVQTQQGSGQTRQPTSRPDAELRAYAPLAHAKYFARAEVWLQNRGPATRPVMLLWTVQGRGRISGDDITLAPNEIQFKDAQSLLPSGVTLADVTGLEIRYDGKATGEVTVFVVLLPSASADGSGAAQALKVPLEPTREFSSPNLDVIWAAPHGDEEVIVSLLNASANPVTVRIVENGDWTPITIPGQSGQLLERPRATKPGAGWLRIEVPTSQEPSPIRPAGFVMSRTDRVPHPLRFHDPRKAANAGLFAAGVRTTNTTLTLAVANVTSFAVTATPTLSSITGGPPQELPLFTLPPGTVRLIDLTPVAGWLSTNDFVTFRIDGDGGRGALLASLYAVDRTTSLGRETPFSDIVERGRSVGFPVFRLDDDYQGTFLVTNPGAAGTFTLYARSGPAMHMVGIQKIGSGATLAFDLRKLSLPESMKAGTLHWSITGPGAPAGLLGRLELISVSKRVAFSISDQ